MNLRLPIKVENLADILREMARALDAGEVKLRKCELTPSVEISSANPFTFPLDVLENVEYADSRIILDLRVEIFEREVLCKIENLQKA